MWVWYHGIFVVRCSVQAVHFKSLFIVCGSKCAALEAVNCFVQLWKSRCMHHPWGGRDRPSLLSRTFCRNNFITLVWRSVLRTVQDVHFSWIFHYRYYQKFPLVRNINEINNAYSGELKPYLREYPKCWDKRITLLRFVHRRCSGTRVK